MPKTNEQSLLSLAASLMGKKGGSRNTEKQHDARKKNIVSANASLTGNSPEETRHLRHAAQLTIPEAKRKARASKAVRARWAKLYLEPGMNNTAFRNLTKQYTAQQLADAIGTTPARINSWRRKSNPVRIPPEDSERIRAWLSKQT